MGPGHLGIGFALKPATPKVSLWVLLVASEVLDLLSFGFEAIGIEDFGINHTDLNRGVSVSVPASIPWSHGLFMAVVWSTVTGAIVYAVCRDHRTSGTIGLVVFSHWVLDFIVHPPDLPLLFAGSAKVGFGLWASGPGLITSGILELALLAGGITIYLVARQRRPALE